MVEDVRLLVLDGNAIRLFWEPVTVLEWEVAHYTVYYTTYHTNLRKTVQHSAKELPSTKTSDLLYLSHTDPKFEHLFQVTVSIEVEGEEFESEKSLLTFNFGKTPTDKNYKLYSSTS